VIRFEILNALRDLDRKTPPFFVSELFAHGDLATRLNAIKALTSPQENSARFLREMLKITP